MSMHAQHEQDPFGDLEARLIARFSPPLRPEAVRRTLAQSVASFHDARVRTYLPVLVERAAVDRLQTIVRRRASRIRLVSQGGAS
jgi:hypothetical protein